MDASAHAYGEQGTAQGYGGETGGTVVKLFGAHESCAESTPIEECCPDCQLEANLRRWTG
ncbi:MAG: hypothetical protein AB1425_14910 [Actinomycetota bacterium]